MIAVETGLFFLKVLCGIEKDTESFINMEKFENILEDYELQMIMNGNPDGRE